MTFSTLFSYIANSIILFGIAYYFYKALPKDETSKYYLSALLFKIFCTIAIGSLYKYFYQSGDIIGFFSNAQTLSELPVKDFLTSVFSSTQLNEPRRTIYFTRALSVLLYITKSDFWLASIYFSLISFISTFYFTIQLNRVYKSIVIPSVISFLFFPSIVFWSSGLTKESLIFGSMLFVIGFVIKVTSKNENRIYEKLGVVVSAVILIYIKYYIAAAVIPTLILYLIFSNIGGKSKNIWYLVIGSTVLVLCLFLLHPNLNPYKFFRFMGIARDTILVNSASENVLQLYSSSNGTVDAFINFFILLFSGFFRPMFFESLHFPFIIASIENTILGLLFCSRFLTPISITKKHLYSILLLIGYVILTALFLAYSSPNFGTLSRLKIYYMPFFLLLVLINHPVINWLKEMRQSRTLD